MTLNNDKKFKNMKTGKVLSAYEYGKNIIYNDWNDLKECGAIPESSSDFHSPNATDEDCLKFGLSVLEEHEDYEEYDVHN